MGVYSILACIFILMLMVSIFSSSIVARTLYPGQHQPNMTYSPLNFPLF